MNPTDYAQFAGPLCGVFGIVLQYAYSAGLKAHWCTLIGAALAGTTFLLVTPYNDDWRLYAILGVVQTGAYGVTIFGGAKATNLGAKVAVKAGANPNHVAVPISPPGG